MKDPETALSTEDVLASPPTPVPYGATDDAKSSSSKTKAIQVPKGRNAKDDDSSTAGRTSSVNSGTVVTMASTKPHVPPQNPCLWLFHLLQGVAALTSVFLLISQVLPFMMGSNVGVLSAILKIYVMLICLAFVVVEAELPVPIMRKSMLLTAFFSRGFIYSFIALVCTTEAYSERVDDQIAHSSQRFYIGWSPIFMQVSSWMMFAIGAVYMMLGMCCLRGWRDKMKQKEKDDWHQYRQDLKAWKRQQKEA